MFILDSFSGSNISELNLIPYGTYRSEEPRVIMLSIGGIVKTTMKINNDGTVSAEFNFLSESFNNVEVKLGSMKANFKQKKGMIIFFNSSFRKFDLRESAWNSWETEPATRIDTMFTRGITEKSFEWYGAAAEQWLLWTKDENK